MTLKKFFLPISLLLLFSFFTISASAQPELSVSTSSNELFGAKAAEITEEFTLEQMLKYAIEDERLAFAEYTFIMEEYNVTKPFSNIIEAEKVHEGYLLDLYKTYGYEVPSFVGSEHVILPNSLEEIYDIGVIAEIENIAMYDKFLTFDLNDDVRTVFEALRDGSLQHLDAFKKQAEKN